MFGMQLDPTLAYRSAASVMQTWSPRLTSGNWCRKHWITPQGARSHKSRPLEAVTRRGEQAWCWLACGGP